LLLLIFSIAGVTRRVKHVYLFFIIEAHLFLLAEVPLTIRCGEISSLYGNLFILPGLQFIFSSFLLTFSMTQESRWLAASAMSLLTIVLPALTCFGTTLAKKKDERAFFGRHPQLRPCLESILTALLLNVECE
jgi:hypothetical protein